MERILATLLRRTIMLKPGASLFGAILLCGSVARPAVAIEVTGREEAPKALDQSELPARRSMPELRDLLLLGIEGPDSPADGRLQLLDTSKRRPLYFVHEKTAIQNNEPSPPRLAPSFKDFHRSLLYNFTRELFSRENLMPIIVGTLGTLAATPFDDEIAEKFAGSVGELGDIGHVVGGPAVVGASVGALLVATRFTENDRFRAFTYTLAQALILDDALFFSIKFAVDRERPNGENHNSFPSGHASNVFTIATVPTITTGRKPGFPPMLRQP